MNKIVVVSLIAITLGACTPREQQLLAAGAVGAVAGAVVANEVSQPRPVYVEQRYVPPRRYRCYSVWENTYRGMVERRVCENHIP